MALEDFERELAEQKETERRRERRKDQSERSDHRHHRHHHRSSRHHDGREDEDGHRSKRPKHSRDDDTSESRHRHRHRHHRRSRGEEDRDGGADHGEEEETATRPDLTDLKRDSWMEAPSALDVDYVQRKKREPSPPKSNSLAAGYELKIHEKELNHHLRVLQKGKNLDDLELEDDTTGAQVDYTFGDAGSQWRMTKLKAVYRQAKESGQKVDEVALERYDNLRQFDEAREEEIELDRRKSYGKDYVGKDKPSGELYQERKLDAGKHRPRIPDVDDDHHDELVEGMAVPASSSASASMPKLDQTALNKLKAQVMKAQLRKDPKASELEREYNEALKAQSQQDPTVITLSAMDNRMLSSAPRNEVKSVTNRRGAERGQVEENEDMSIDDMVREERRTRGQAGGDGARLAERIAKDGKFDNDLDYLDENAAKLAKRVHKSDANLRNVAIGEYQKLNRILENCPLCHHEDTDTPPVAPVVSLGTRAFLTLPTEPELAPYAAMIVPTQHHTNLLACDDDEWEEMRNFMKSLTRLYHEMGQDVIFYENAAFPHRKPHAAMVAVPLPYSLGETAPAFFREAFLSAEGEWSQHKKIIDTLAKAKKEGLGKVAFRRSLVKEMPYFHVWLELDGGLGHVVEESERWPKGDLFAREIIGGMLGLEPDVVKRQGRWHRGGDKRVDGFRKKWRKFDWTRVLTEGGA